MKATLLALTTLAAMATVAQADTNPLTGAKQIFETVTTDTLVVENWTPGAMTVAVELNVDAVKQQLTTTWIDKKSDPHTIFDCNGTWNSEAQVYREGVLINGSTSGANAYGTPYGEAYSGNGSAQNLAFGSNLSEKLKFDKDTQWDTFDKMSLVLTMNGGETMTATWVILDTKGEYQVYSGSKSGVKWGVSTQFKPNGTISNIDTNMVNYAAVFEGAKNLQDSEAIAKAVLQRVPEPTTGTLSLLALAGLCIRRRK